jgi:hypothetical protein
MESPETTQKNVVIGFSKTAVSRGCHNLERWLRVKGMAALLRADKTKVLLPNWLAFLNLPRVGIDS